MLLVWEVFWFGVIWFEFVFLEFAHKLIQEQGTKDVTGQPSISSHLIGLGRI